MADSTQVRGHVTTEQTSKRLKLRLALSIAAMCVGIVLMLANMGTAEGGKTSTAFNAGGLMTFFGLVSAWITKVKIWWHHG